MMPIIRHPSSLEAVLLTGGQSTRMGTDKAALTVGGVPLAERVLSELRNVCDRVTALGRSPLPGCEFLADQGEYEGPLAALARFVPTSMYVMVASCDLPLFDHAVVEVLQAHIGTADAAIPMLEGRQQPLCALYRANAFEKCSVLSGQGERRIMAWVRGLRVVEVSSEEEPRLVGVRNVNTPEELAALGLV